MAMALSLPSSSSYGVEIDPDLRRRVVEFLINASLKLAVSPMVKYTALAFFAHRFIPSVTRRRLRSCWLLKSVGESNLQLFALISIWVSSKVHDSRHLSVKNLKALGDKLINDQHFTTRDFVEAVGFWFLCHLTPWVHFFLLSDLLVLRFDIGACNIPFVFLEDFLIQFREISKFGDLVKVDVCMDIMDLLYETEEFSEFCFSSHSLAAAVLVTAYLISIPVQQTEFPLLPWLKLVTSCTEEEIGQIVTRILLFVLKSETTN